MVMPPLRLSAEDFATLAHDGQVRKYNKGPYIQHPERVVAKLKEWGVTDQDVLDAGWLHDTVEDCGVKYEEIVRRFGMRVGVLVYYLTKDIQASKGADKEEAREAMFQKLKEAPVGALIIKAADRIDNLNDYPDGMLKASYIEESKDIRRIMGFTPTRPNDIFLEACLALGDAIMLNETRATP